MEIVTPQPFTDAVQKLGQKSPIAIALKSKEWAGLPLALRERAMFSSMVENTRFLQRASDMLGGFLNNNRESTNDNGETALQTGSRQRFIQQMQNFAISEGMGDIVPESKRGGLEDITSEKRLGLIFDTQTRQAQDYAYWKQGQDQDVLDAFPAQQLIRVIDVKEPRNTHSEWENVPRLKSDLGFWTQINQDFGVPWGPWGWGCGHEVEDVDRDQAEALGLIKPGQQARPVEAEFNERLQASARNLDPEIKAALSAKLGDSIEFVGDTIQWRSNPPQPAPQPATPPVKIPDPIPTPEPTLYPPQTLDNVLKTLGLKDPKVQASSGDMVRMLTALKKVNPPKHEDHILSITGADNSGLFAKEKIKSIVSEFLSFFPKDSVRNHPKIKFLVEDMDGALGEYSSGRIRLARNEIMNSSQLKKTIFHEMMHWFHMEGGQKYKDAIKAHFEERTKDEPTRQLKKYNAGTVGKKDGWYDSYAGRIYNFSGGRNGLELPTRYIEWLTMDPEKMADLWNKEKFQETMKIVLSGLF